MSFEAIALRAVASRYGLSVHRSRHGVVPFVAEALFSLRPPEASQSEWEAFQQECLADLFPRSIVPDGWAFVPGGVAEWGDPYAADRVARVVAIEVEDTHRLSIEKLQRYSALWWAYDGTDVLDLKLLSVDRYGANPRWFDMVSVGYMLNSAGAGAPLIGQEPRFLGGAHVS
jgi:hypothetical protein